MYLTDKVFGYPRGMGFKDKIKMLREDAGMTQDQLGQRFAVGQKEALSKQAISAWEAGRNQPTAEQVILMCRIFNTSADDLLGTGDINQEPRNLRDVAELISLYGRLSGPERSLVLAYARSTVSNSAAASAAANDES